MPRTFDTPLPIDAVLDELAATLTDHNAAVLVAPPGAGKTTRVPLALLDAPWLKNKKIIMLEPRRIAARASAERMARTLGERAGETVGYRVRFGSKISRATRIEVVTEGIFSRQILDDPELSGVAAVDCNSAPATITAHSRHKTAPARMKVKTAAALIAAASSVLIAPIALISRIPSAANIPNVINPIPAPKYPP